MTDVAEELEEAGRLLADLVGIPSINPAFAGADQDGSWLGESAIGDFVAEFLRAAGIDVVKTEVEPGRYNVSGWVEARRPRGRLLFETHMDTVQVDGMTVPPFGARTEGSRLYGRGATDAKGSLAAMLLAMRQLARDGGNVASVGLTAVVDEEYRYAGVSHLIGELGQVDAAVVGEPTGLDVARACKGCVRWRIKVAGRGGHTSDPKGSVNAVDCAAALVTRLGATLGRLHAARAHPLVGTPTLSVTGIEGGTGPNTIPPDCVVTLDRRTIPGETVASALAEAWEVVAGVQSEWPGAEIAFEPPFIEDVAMEVPADAPIIGTMIDAGSAVGHGSKVVGVPFGCDASKLYLDGIPAVVFGPGSIAQAHAADEYVDLTQVVWASRILVATATRFRA